MRWLLCLLAACSFAEPQPEVYQCATFMGCDGNVSNYSYSQCETREEAEAEVTTWISTCSNETGALGCADWSCRETCHPTGDSCVAD